MPTPPCPPRSLASLRDPAQPPSVNRSKVNQADPPSISYQSRRMVAHTTTYPRNARSLRASRFSTPAGTSGTSACSSIEREDASTIDLSVGTDGGASSVTLPTRHQRTAGASIYLPRSRVGSLDVIKLFKPRHHQCFAARWDGESDPPPHETVRLRGEVHLFGKA